jgi:hypothetical protein
VQVDRNEIPTRDRFDDAFHMGSALDAPLGLRAAPEGLTEWDAWAESAGILGWRRFSVEGLPGMAVVFIQGRTSPSSLLGRLGSVIGTSARVP